MKKRRSIRVGLALPLAAAVALSVMSSTPRKIDTELLQYGGEVERHDRDIENFTDVHGSLILSGKITVDDGFNKCRKNVPVKIQRQKNSGKFKTLKKVRTNRRGKFSATVKDREGVYRAKAVKKKKNRRNICKPASARLTHSH